MRYFLDIMYYARMHAHIIHDCNVIRFKAVSFRSVARKIKKGVIIPNGIFKAFVYAHNKILQFHVHIRATIGCINDGIFAHTFNSVSNTINRAKNAKGTFIC